MHNGHFPHLLVPQPHAWFHHTTPGQHKKRGVFPIWTYFNHEETLRDGWSDELHCNFVAGDISELPDLEGLFCIKSIWGVAWHCHALNTRGKLVDGSCLLWCSQLWGQRLLCSRLPCTWHCLHFFEVNLRDPCFFSTQLFVTCFGTDKWFVVCIFYVFQVFALGTSTTTS